MALGCVVTEELRAMGKAACPEPYDLAQLARLGFIDFQFRYKSPRGKSKRTVVPGTRTIRVR